MNGNVDAMAHVKTILLVEDDPDLRGTTAAALEECGYNVVTAANGVEALELLRGSATVQLILLDLMMPRMNGFEFRERQLKDATLASIPVVVITAYGQMLDQSGPMARIPVLRKPLKLEDLERLVERLGQ